jgi:hypothetical protein
MSAKCLFVLLLATGMALADEAPDAKRAEAKAKAKQEEAQAQTKGEAQAKTKEEPKEDPNLGMSILGNQETPKSLVIVPWKRSEIGNSLGISPMLDDSRLPVDKEVFMRVLSYYQVRSTSTHQVGASAGGRDTAAAEPSDAAQPAPADRRK